MNLRLSPFVCRHLLSSSFLTFNQILILDCSYFRTLWLIETCPIYLHFVEFVHLEFVKFAVGLLQLCLLVVSVPSDVVLSTICSLRVNFCNFDCSF